MNGAQALIRTLVAADVNVCFTNPGTSEMHFVAAVDSVPEMRSVLCLFEGVATGAADGYGRMADRPASTLLHLGPGLGNGLANLHNARRAGTPVINIVGDHATFHKQFDAPLESDIDSVAETVSGWVRRCMRIEDLATDTAEAVAAAMGPPAQVATLILPADTSWSNGAEPAGQPKPAGPDGVDDPTIREIADALRSGEPCALFLGGRALRVAGLEAASRVASATGAKLLAETFPTRLERGAGIPAVERLGYLAEFATAQLSGLRHLIVVDSRPPVSFFAYPGRPSSLVPEGCDVHQLAGARDDAVVALVALADAVAAGVEPVHASAARPGRPTGALSGEALANAVGAVLPEAAIVVDEANTSGLWVAGATAGAPPHDWLTLTGGAIGFGMPVATGAAVACPDRPVINLEADGSAMYTIQALWTQARQGLDITTVMFNNRSYAVLNMELSRVGAGTPGPKALEMLDLSGPDLDFVSLAEGMGVPASRATSAEELTAMLERAIAEPGPHLIDAVIPSAF